jgi:hypothetical protein
MRLDASGNLGLGVTPSAWSTFTAIQVTTGGAFYAYQNPFEQIGIVNNGYFNGSGWIYTNSGSNSSRYHQYDGQHLFYTAPSGTAGNAISFTQAMTLGSNSGLSIGTPSAAPAQGLLVQGASTLSSNVGIARTAAARRLEIQQALGGNAATIGLYDGGGSLTSVIGTEPNTNDFQIANSAGIRFYAGSSIGNVVTEPTNERMRITSAGNVGIGTSSPAAVLHSLGSGIVNIVQSTNTVSYTQYYSTSTGNGGTNDGFTVGVNGTTAYVWQREADALLLGTSNTEAVRITSTGNVGIGTTSPARGLSLFNNTIGLYSSATGQGGIDGYTMELAGTTAYLWNYENDSLVFGTNNAERMRILANGNVGIGTSSPSGKLHLSSTGDTYLVMTGGASPRTYSFLVDATNLRLFSGVGDTTLLTLASTGAATFSSSVTATGGLYVGSGTLGRNAFSQSDFRIAAPNDTNILNGIASNTSMTIKSDYYGGGSATPLILQSSANSNQLYLATSGNVGIGTASPESIGAGVTTLDIQGSNSGGIAFGPSGTKNYIYGAGTLFIEANTTAVFTTGGSERMRLNSTGLGIGTTSPNSLLEVNRTITFSSIDTYAQLVVKTTSGANGKLLNIGVDETNSVSFIQSLNRGTDAMPLSLQRYGGAVLIGTTSDVSSVGKFVINFGSDSNFGIILNNTYTATSNNGYFNRYYNNGTEIATFYAGNSAGSLFNIVGKDGLAFATGGTPIGTERMRINSSGNVLIGGTSSDYGKLDVTVSPSSYTAALGLGLQTNSGEGNSVGISFKTKISLSGAIWENARIAAFTDAVSSSVYGALAFYTMSATTLSERMRIGNNGFVGIGVVSPAYKLEVNSSTGDNHIAAVGTAPSLQLMSANTGPANWATIGMATATNNFIVGSAAGDLAIANRGTTAGNMLFGFGSSEKMRLTSNGDLCINATATTASAKLYVNGTAAFGSVYVASLGTGTVYSNAGTLTNTNPSDFRLKNTINPLTYGLNEVLQLNPKTFYYNDDVTKARLKYGFIAQEVKEVMPDLVRKLGADTDYLGLENEGIFVTLVNAIKEQQAQINELKSQLNK